jgi:sigma-B regulation protein RsbQ
MTRVSSENSVLHRNSVRVSGNLHGRPIIFAHGFGCDQNVWREVAPQFAHDFAVVTYDHVGAGDSDLTAYDRGKYDSLDGYASDLLEIIRELDLHDAIFVGHSVSSMIGVLASNREPSRFGSLILVGPSARYVNAENYVGGFDQTDIDSLLDALDLNYLGWSSTIAPVIMGNADRPDLGDELTANFCRIDPVIASQFAKVTFLSDNRDDLSRVSVRTLILQSSDDVIAPLSAGAYVHEQIAGSTMVVLTSQGHIPNLSDPEQLVREISAFIQ